MAAHTRPPDSPPKMTTVAAPAFERGPLAEAARGSGPFTLNVKLPGRPDPERAHLTRFQSKAPPQLTGEMVSVSCKGSDTVAKLKDAVAAASGTKPQWIRAGGTQAGAMLEDSRTLESYGFGYSMGPWEHLWADSEENQAKLQEEIERVKALVITHKDDMKKNGM